MQETRAATASPASGLRSDRRQFLRGLFAGTAGVLGWLGPFPARADSSPAAELQGLIDQAAAGGTVELPPGSYDLDRPLRLTRPLTLKGAGATSVLRQHRYPFPAIVVEADGCALSALAIAYSGERPNLDGQRFHAMHASAEHSGVLILSASGVSIDGVQVTDFGRGFTFAGGGRVQVSAQCAQEAEGGVLLVQHPDFPDLLKRFGPRVFARASNPDREGRKGEWMPVSPDADGRVRIPTTWPCVADRDSDIEFIFGRSSGNSLTNASAEGVEFGLSFQMQDGLSVDGFAVRNLVQVSRQQGRITAPGHAIYGADRDERGLQSGSITLRNVTATDDTIGTTAFKVHGAENVVVENARSERFGGIFSFDEIADLRVSGFEALACRSVLPGRPLRVAALLDLGKATLSDGSIEVAGLSDPANKGNYVIGLLSRDESYDSVAVTLERISIKLLEAASPPDADIDVVLVKGRRFGQPDCSLLLSQLSIDAAAAAPRIAGFRFFDVAAARVVDPTLAGLATTFNVDASVAGLSVQVRDRAAIAPGLIRDASQGATFELLPS